MFSTHYTLGPFLDLGYKEQQTNKTKNIHGFCVAYILEGETENKYKQEVMQSILGTYKCITGK